VSSDPLFILTVLALNVAASEWASRVRYLHHLGSALLVIVLTALVANLGIIPTYSDDLPIYTAIFAYVAPLAIFLLLLQVNVRGMLQAGRPMVLLFLLGAVGTMLGVSVGMWAVGGSQAFGELHYALGGMFVGTYVGGSINFNAIALEYGVVKNGPLYAGAAAIDSAMTTIWMAATVFLPRVLGRGRVAAAPVVSGAAAPDRAAQDRESVEPLHMALLLALGLAAVWLSEAATRGLASVGVGVPSILVLTTFALGLAQLPAIQRLSGARTCGWLAVLFFLAVIGALCDLESVAEIGALGRSLMLFVAVAVCVHGLVVFGVGAALRLDPGMAAIASQANIGGGTSALALARSLGRNDLVLPALLIGSLGNALGTYLGFLTAFLLR